MTSKNKGRNFKESSSLQTNSISFCGETEKSEEKKLSDVIYGWPSTFPSPYLGNKKVSKSSYDPLVAATGRSDGIPTSFLDRVSYPLFL